MVYVAFRGGVDNKYKRSNVLDRFVKKAQFISSKSAHPKVRQLCSGCFKFQSGYQAVCLCDQCGTIVRKEREDLVVLWGANPARMFVPELVAAS